MKLIEIMFACCMLSSCTVSMNMIQTKGTASDVIDENQSPTNDIRPDISIPVVPGGLFEC